MLLARRVDPLREEGLLPGRQPREPLLPDGGDHLARGVDADEGETGPSREEEDLPVVVPVVSPVLEPAGRLEEPLLVEPAGVPLVEDLLLGRREHLEADDDLAARPLQLLERPELDAVEVHVRVALADEEEPDPGEPRRQVGVREGQHLRGEHAGVRGTGLSHGHGRNGHARRHLHRGQQGVEASQRRRVDGDADHGTGRQRGDHARKMGGGARADNEHLYAPARRLRDQPMHARGRPVSRRHGHLARDAKFTQDVDRAFHDRGVGIGTHQDQNLDL